MVNVRVNTSRVFQPARTTVSRVLQPGIKGNTGKSLVWRGMFLNTNAYNELDIVEYEGSSYIAIQDSIGIDPTDANYWELVALRGEKGISWKGTYTANTNYETFDVVYFEGSSYIAIQQAFNNDPTDANYWELLASKGDDNDKHFSHTQHTSSTQWLIEHNLDKFPSITTFDSSGQEIEGCEFYLDGNNVRIEFSHAISGKAYLN